MLDEISTVRLDNQIDDFSLSLPDVRIVDRERCFGHQREEFLKAPHYVEVWPWARASIQ
jgi:hypothetical protein